MFDSITPKSTSTQNRVSRLAESSCIPFAKIKPGVGMEVAKDQFKIPKINKDRRPALKKVDCVPKRRSERKTAGVGSSLKTVILLFANHIQYINNLKYNIA